MPPRLCAEVAAICVGPYELKSVEQKSSSGGVEWARCAMAAVTMSPPQVSSMFRGMPALTARSRTARALVRPPTLDILRFMRSAARSDRIRTSMPMSSILSSITKGSGHLWRTLRHSSYERQGCSMYTSRFFTPFTTLRASCTSQPVLASHSRGMCRPASPAARSSAVLLSSMALTACILSMSSLALPPTFSWKIRYPICTYFSTLAAMFSALSCEMAR
mmetsp:Transcript_27343/g.60532  ORF Transcript_27343/g.60532 Transcript_27343/m.60532 type:complete len:219 (+) Transcript_27343:98-754(+)